MIRDLVFSWHSWVIWYGTTAFVWTATQGRRRDKHNEPTIYKPFPPEEPPEPDDQKPVLIMANQEDDNVFDIRAKPDRPDWMKK